jgi:hypothetical protein
MAMFLKKVSKSNIKTYIEKVPVSKINM